MPTQSASVASQYRFFLEKKNNGVGRSDEDLTIRMHVNCKSNNRLREEKSKRNDSILHEKRNHLTSRDLASQTLNELGKQP